MKVRVVLIDGTYEDYADRKTGEGKTLDRDEFWAEVTGVGTLNIWRRHLDGSTWEDGVSDFTDTVQLVITYGTAGWVSVEGPRQDPARR